MNLNALLTYLRDRSWTPSVVVADRARAKKKKPRAKPRTPRMIEAFELEDLDTRREAKPKTKPDSKPESKPDSALEIKPAADR